MSKHTIIGNEIVLYSNVMTDKPERYTCIVALPTKDWDGEQLNVLDWKIDSETKACTLTYQTRNELYAPIHVHSFPSRIDIEMVKPPGKSKNWVWSECFGYYRNTKTGQRWQPA